VTTAASIQAWLIEQIARERHLEPASIDPLRPIAALGVDSLTAATLVAELEDLVGRPLPESLFRESITIADVSRIVAAPAAPSSSPPVSRRGDTPSPDYAALDYADWTRAQRRLQRVARAVARLCTRQDVEGVERLPASGAVVIAINHLHILDALWMFSALSRPTVFLVAHEFRTRPLVGWLLSIGHTIFVARGAGDRRAIEDAIAVLRAGGAVAIAPEGRLSRTGGLIRGHSGVARVAFGAAAPVIPIAMSGQEKVWRSWIRGRRAPIRIRVGAMIEPPRGSGTAKELEGYVDRIMRALARELPPEYRGLYSETPHPQG
jgi:1-acyl-sn-glycerol-3-phosphate acyltransferase